MTLSDFTITPIPGTGNYLFDQPNSEVQKLQPIRNFAGGNGTNCRTELFPENVNGGEMVLPDVGIEAEVGPLRYIPPPPPAVAAAADDDVEIVNGKRKRNCNGRPNRWPQRETQTLITTRALMDPKFPSFSNGGKDIRVWEEISQAMSRLGYKRNAMRCKEKWEHMLKLFMRALGSGKSSAENAKACPYFGELYVLYNNGMIKEMNSGTGSSSTNQIWERLPCVADLPATEI